VTTAGTKVRSVVELDISEAEPAAVRRVPVTIVIPCFNYGKFVGEAVESALAQAGAEVRVVVVNDGSTDGRSGKLCDRCVGERVEVIHQDNRGLPAARNRGARGARTDYLAFLDADDRLEPTFVADLAGAIEQERLAGRDGDVSHAYGQQRVLERAGESLWAVPDWDPLLLMMTNLHPPTTLVRRERFEAVGGFDETMRDGYEDWDFWLTMAERGWRGVRVRKPVYSWRRHSSTTMITQAVAKHEALYRHIVANHRLMFERNADALIARMNVMLRRHDMNWLDESGEPINLLALRAQRERYEAMTAVRAHRALHRVIDAMPGPVSGAARGILAAIKRAVPARP
jgi:glycosyltransferase involved in cell wall biosynthesis